MLRRNGEAGGLYSLISDLAELRVAICCARLNTLVSIAVERYRRGYGF